MSRLPALLSPADQDTLRRVISKVRQQDANLTNRIGGAESEHRGYLPPGFIRFKNTASETAPRGAVMRIITGASYDNEYIPIAKPDTSFNRLYLVNIGGNVPQDGFGKASFLTAETFRLKTNVVLYDTGNTPAFGESWGAKSDSWKLWQHRPGFLIQGGNTGSGDAARTIAIQKIVTAVFGKADAAIASGAAGTVRVYGGTAGSEADTGQTIASCWNEGADIADESDLKVRWLHGKPYIEQFSGGSSTETFRGVTDAAINKGASGTVSRYNAAGSDTGSNDTVTNLFANVGSGKKVIYIKIESTFFMISAECPMT